MALKYTFRHLFFKGILRPKRLYALLEDLDSRITNNTSGDSTVASDVSTLKTTVGGANSGLVKNVSDLTTTVGGADSGLVKEVSDLSEAIGDESSEGSILARIKALEDAS